MTCAYVPTAPVSPPLQGLQGSGRVLDAVTTLDPPLRVAWADERAESRTATQARPANRVARISLASEGAVTCTVTAHGEFFVQTQEVQGQQRRIAGHGSVTLPKGIAADSFRVQRQVFDGSRTMEAVVTWGTPGNPAARLRIMSPSVAASAFDWCKVRMRAGLPLPLLLMHPRLGMGFPSYSGFAACPFTSGAGVWVCAGVPDEEGGRPGGADDRHGVRGALVRRRCAAPNPVPKKLLPRSLRLSNRLWGVRTNVCGLLTL